MSVIITRTLSHGQVLYIEWTSADLRSWWRWTESAKAAERFASTAEMRFRDALAFALRDGDAVPKEVK